MIVHLNIINIFEKTFFFWSFGKDFKSEKYFY